MKSRTVLISIILAILVFLVYRPVAHFDFLNYDDGPYLTDNPAVRKGLSAQGIYWALTTSHAGNWHPVTWLSHMIDVEIFGFEPGMHHLTSVIFHAANAMLLFCLLNSVTGSLWRSGCVAAVFAVHPLQVESVVWLAERKNVLSTFFLFLTMLMYFHYARRPSVSRYLGVLMLFALGLMAKPMLVTVPFVLLLLDFWPLCRGVRRGHLNAGEKPLPKDMIRLLLIEKAPLLALTVVSSVITLIAQKQAGAIQTMSKYSLTSRLANAVASYMAYIGKAVWPTNLNVFYPYAGDSLPLWHIITALTVLAAMSWAAIRLRTGKPYVFLGWFWYLGTLVPVIGMVQVGNQGMADRYTYIPLIGLYILVAWLLPELDSLWRHARFTFPLVAALIIAGFAQAAHRQVPHWKDTSSLFERALSINPEDSNAHLHIGNELHRQGKYQEAVGHFNRILELYPDSMVVHFNIANSLAAEGSAEEALEHYGKLLNGYPEYGEGYNNRGVLLMKMSRFAEAGEDFWKAVVYSPRNAEAHNNYGNVLVSTGEDEGAFRHFSRALEIDRDHWRAHFNLANLFRKTGKAEMAIHHYRETLRINPGHGKAQANLRLLLNKRQGFSRPGLPPVEPSALQPEGFRN